LISNKSKSKENLEKLGSNPHPKNLYINFTISKIGTRGSLLRKKYHATLVLV
jgi:hypothetical protein